jgi:antitoxin CptB
LDPRRRRVLFRAWHRGTREMDFILGQFVNAELERMSEADLDVFEHLLEAQDSDLYEWVSGRATPPPEYDSEILRRIRAFHAAPRTD